MGIHLGGFNDSCTNRWVIRFFDPQKSISTYGFDTPGVHPAYFDTVYDLCRLSILTGIDPWNCGKILANHDYNIGRGYMRPSFVLCGQQ